MIKDQVAFVLALGFVIAVNIVTISILWSTLTGEIPGLSENGTQVLITIFSGMIGILGAYLGYQFGKNNRQG